MGNEYLIRLLKLLSIQNSNLLSLKLNIYATCEQGMILFLPIRYLLAILPNSSGDQHFYIYMYVHMEIGGHVLHPMKGWRNNKMTASVAPCVFPPLNTHRRFKWMRRIDVPPLLFSSPHSSTSRCSVFIPKYVIMSSQLNPYEAGTQIKDTRGCLRTDAQKHT